MPSELKAASSVYREHDGFTWAYASKDQLSYR